MSRIARIKSELRYYRALAADPRTPMLAKWLMAGALAYLVMPFDLIPDFIPVVGHIDDLIIIPLLIGCALKLTPAALRDELRNRP